MWERITTFHVPISCLLVIGEFGLHSEDSGQELDRLELHAVPTLDRHVHEMRTYLRSTYNQVLATETGNGWSFMPEIWLGSDGCIFKREPSKFRCRSQTLPAPGSKWVIGEQDIQVLNYSFGSSPDCSARKIIMSSAVA